MSVSNSRPNNLTVELNSRAKNSKSGNGLNVPVLSDGPLIERVFNWVEQASRRNLAVGFALYFVAVTALDFVSGDQHVLAMLYLPVIGFVTLRVSLTAAFYASLICASLWLVDDIFVESVSRPTRGEFLSAVFHFACFTVVSTLMCRLSIALKREKLFARSDFLTGLPNRYGFHSKASEILNENRLESETASLVFIDCDNFKTVNDTLGHHVGDELLQSIGKILNSSVRANDCVARYGGDEFVILLTKTSKANALEIMERTKSSLDAAMKLHDWPVSFSIGIAVFPANALRSIEDAVKKADEMMYQRKQQAKNGITTQVFENSIE